MRARLAIALLAALASGAARAADQAWLPLEAGRRWTYEVHRDHSYIPEKGSIDRVFHRGTATQTVRAADAFGRGAFAVEEQLRLDPLAAGTREESFQVRVMTSGRQIALLGSGSIAHSGDDPPARYQPPLPLLPTDVPGTSWAIGEYVDGTMRIDLRGQVIGPAKHGDVPDCDGCLEVVYQGPISGRIPIYGGDAEIVSGTLERRVWYKRGVGIVREVGNVATELVLPDHGRARTAHTLTMRLVEQTPAP